MSEPTELEQVTAFWEWSKRRPGESRRLTRAAALIESLVVQPSAVPVVGVVGSKGKGTAAVHASATLKLAGLTVGTVLSPGIITSRDRIRVDGAVLPTDVYEQLLTEVAAAVPAKLTGGYLSPSGFYTIAGLHHFQQVGCDIAVIEAGIGGSSDELSLLNPVALAVTQVFLEHQELLGYTTAAIAADKVGAAQAGTRFITTLAQSSEVGPVIRAHAAAIGAQLHEVAGCPASPAGAAVTGFSERNAQLGWETARRYLDSIGVPTPDITAVIETVNYPGRLSRHRVGRTDLIVDSAITGAGLRNALEFAAGCFGGDPELIVVSLPADKDFTGFVETLRHHPSQVVFVDQPGSHLCYPARADWPREWAEVSSLPRILGEHPTVLAAGTATFTGAVLATAGVDAGEIF